MIGQRTLLLEPREVPLGGVRAMSVLRTLPNRDIPTVGAWCFLDRFGPDEVRMRVDPHPHIGLQTVTWPLVGRIRHRDSEGNDVTLERGQLNLMTAGDGISHSEYSVGDDPIPLDALQLWVVLPDSARAGAAGFEQHTSLPSVTVPAETGANAAGTVVLGEFAGVRSPATVYTPIVGAEFALAPASRVVLPLDPAWEHAVVLIDGDLTVDDRMPAPDEMLYLGDSRSGVTLSTTTGARIFLLGGEPFEEDLVMWWNFAARTHDEIERAREDWESAEAAARFGRVVDHGEERIPAPELPHVTLKPRRRSI
ncbi:redox-sensitive bicupin YhaK (pirin superfamily) [Microbacterium ginsengiterrae]|uniref:Redox-sensitive bicupin YhaK (Pirin superfamily) n=1 Tax=Microbacterium ginsengiterrae TaxID=546115 RepID=A0A7W9CCH4_9MICO|nr:pirin family protein [Microbacterium ginsengiterrae]MBB5743062.1 redox-sensitive bicupin YhaK (pirin superfamily) [Microbacterium ginsengiterrae]